MKSKIKDFYSSKSAIWSKLLLIFLAALSARMLFIAIFIISRPEVFKSDKWQSAELGWVAINLYAGRGFSSPFKMGDTPTAFFAPLVPMVWSGIFHITNGPRGDSEALIIILQAFISAFTVCVIWASARLFEQKYPGQLKGFAFWIGIIFILWPESIISTTDSWYFIWQDAGLALLVFLGMFWFDSQTLIVAAGLGLLAGFIANVNPVPLPIYFFILFFPLLNRNVVKRAAVRSILLSLAIAGALIIPWTIRNYIIFNRLIPMRSGFGLELWQGNNPDGGVRQNYLSPHPIINSEELNKYQRIGEIEYFQSDMQAALNFMFTHPGITMQRILGRVYVSWFTDIFDHWSWFPNVKWWQGGNYQFLVNITGLFSAILPLSVNIYGLTKKMFIKLAYGPIFLSIFLFMPLTYYFTTASRVYLSGMRDWLAFLAVFVLFKLFHRL